MGTKRNRFLIRQPRIKRDSDTLTSQTSPDIMDFDTGPLLSVPPRIERHASEPAHNFAPSTSAAHLLSVQPSTHFLVKQHSHPLLPSQQTSHIAAAGTSSSHLGFGLHRQFSHPHSSTLSGHPTEQPLFSTSARTLPNSPITINPVTSSSSASAAAANLMHFVTTTSIKQELESPAKPQPCSSSSVILLSEPNTGNVAASSSFDHAPTLRVKTEELQRSVSSPQTNREIISLESPRSSHCPVVRQGPALGCNFCWNTIDGHGRILRRKTKYHCPECQTNLCIVPCFQEYHERKSNENQSGTDNPNFTSATGLRSYSKTEST